MRVLNTPETITIRPEPSAWKHACASGEFVTSELSGIFRAELGLPVGPIIMSGHQAEWWHSGILAKYLAAQSYAKLIGAAAVWVVVDQDTGTPELLNYPGERWSVRRYVFGANGDEFRPLCERRSMVPEVTDVKALCPSVAKAVGALCTSLGSHVHEPTLAKQVMGAISEHDFLRSMPMRMVFASQLNETTLFKKLVERMNQDPTACVGSYNEAVEAVPSSKMRKLRESSDPELPLWSVSKDGIRTAAKVSSSSGRLMPRALLMTAMLRMAGCELFIHGLGGGVYDTVTELWIKSWLGVDLAPMAVVSATRYARPSDAPRVVTREEAIEALRRVHRAKHHPAELGDHDAEHHRNDIVKRIARSGGGERIALYKTLQTWLRAHRERHDATLTAMESQARELQAAARAGGGACDRTWPFMFLSSSQFEDLKNEIDHAFKRGCAT